MKNYVVAGCKPWNRSIFERELRLLPGRWFYLAQKEQLTVKWLKQIRPRFIFFLHWSWLVPERIFAHSECVCFHMTDVPYGRGGSPLQNLIARGRRQTMLSALRMVRELDAGPVYLKEPLSLEGNAEEIFIRANSLVGQMIRHIITKEPQPMEQKGKVVIFRRRTPAQSEIMKGGALQKLYDFIRMLDAQGYPRAFLRYKGFRFEFSRAGLYDGELRADVSIKKDTVR